MDFKLNTKLNTKLKTELNTKLIRKARLSTRAKAWHYEISKRDTDEVIYRQEQAELAQLTFARSLYQGYNRANKNSDVSLNYYCYILSTRANVNSPAYYRNWYRIYRHFCVRLGFDLTEMKGLDYRILKFISECGIVIMDRSTILLIIEHLTSSLLTYDQKWKYVLKIKNERKAALNIK